MVMDFYAWTPLVVVAAVFILSMPWLGLIALMIAAIVALVGAALAWAVLFVPYMLSRVLSRCWPLRGGATPRTAPGLSPERQHESVLQGAPLHPSALSVTPELQAPQHTFPEAHVS